MNDYALYIELSQRGTGLTPEQVKHLQGLASTAVTAAIQTNPTLHATLARLQSHQRIYLPARTAWEAENARMWCGDARQLPLPNESVQLIVTSPPYNAKIRYRGYKDWQTWGEYWDGLIVPALKEMYRVLVPGGRVCINFANILRYRAPKRQTWGHLTETVLWPALMEIGFLPRERITWVKGKTEDMVAPSTAWGSWASPSNPVLRAVAEPIFVASKGTYQRYSKVPSAIDHDDFLMLTRNVWEIPQEPHKSNPFPARFPVELARRCITLYSYRYDTVLDPFAGSGTTLLATRATGRKGAAVELSAAYCNVAQLRYRKAMMQS